MDDFGAQRMPPGHPNQPLEAAGPLAPGNEQSTGMTDSPGGLADVVERPEGNIGVVRDVGLGQYGTGLDRKPDEGGEEAVKAHDAIPAGSSADFEGGVGEVVDPGIVDRDLLSAQMVCADISQGDREGVLEEVEVTSSVKESGGKRVASPRAGLDEAGGEVQGEPKKQRLGV
jgi:hypothetical protein